MEDTRGAWLPYRRRFRFDGADGKKPVQYRIVFAGVDAKGWNIQLKSMAPLPGDSNVEGVEERKLSLKEKP